MNADRVECVERFMKALSEWLDRWVVNRSGRLDVSDEEHTESWEVMLTPWYKGPVAHDVYGHLTHIISNCEALLEDLQRVADGSIPEEDDFDMFIFLRGISPFQGGYMCEIKYMTYEFSPLYHNIMNRALLYMNADRVAEARAAHLLWAECDSAKPVECPTPPPAGALARHLGNMGTLTADELAALETRLIEVWRMTGGFLAEVDRCPAYLEGPVWVGLVRLQAALQDVATAIVRLEPAWAAYEHTWLGTPD